jgi:hypothetical protein
MKVKCYLVIILLVLLSWPLLGQVFYVQLKPANDPIQGAGYQIQEVIDLRLRKGPIGKVHTLSGTSQDVSFRKNLDISTLDYFKSKLPNPSSSPLSIQARIHELNIKERKSSSANIYEGDVQLVMDFYKIGSFDPVFLVDFTGSAQYQRSPNRMDMIENVVNRVFKNSLTYFDTWMKMQVMEHKELAKNVRMEISDIAKPIHKDTVYYHTDRPLRWEDFRDRPQRSSRFNASIFTSFSMQGKSMIEAGEIVQQIEIDVYMLPEQSWVKNPSDYSLNHEQRHFDVTRIVADRLINKLENLVLDPEWYEATINDAYFEAYREMNRLQEIYDKQTRHGMDTLAQERWNRMLDEALKGDWSGIDQVLKEEKK